VENAVVPAPMVPRRQEMTSQTLYRKKIRSKRKNENEIKARKGRRNEIKIKRRENVVKKIKVSIL